MPATSCVQRPTQDTFVVIRASYVKICNGNVTAAALISFFEYWHNYRLERIRTWKELEGKPPNLWQHHTAKALEKGIMGMSKRHLIDVAKAQLQQMGIIEIGRNPDYKFAFDATLHYKFCPENLNRLLAFVENSKTEPLVEVDVSGYAENGEPADVENSGAISEDTSMKGSEDSSAAGGGGASVNGSGKHKKKAAKKTPGAEPDKDRQRWIDRYEDHVKEHNNGIGHNWKGAQLGAQGINGIREHLVKVSTKMEGKSDDDCGYGAWCYILDHWLELGDDWLQGQFDLTVILKKITDILNRLKNGGTKSNRGANSNGAQAGTSRERVDAIKQY